MHFAVKVLSAVKDQFNKKSFLTVLNLRYCETVNHYFI
jgi:hypothetical protein